MYELFEGNYFWWQFKKFGQSKKEIKQVICFGATLVICWGLTQSP